MPNRSPRRSDREAKRRRFRQRLFETLENRLMFAEDTARQPLLDPTAAAPTITAAYVSSPTFTTRFAQNLVTSGQGVAGGFLKLPESGDQSLPWGVNGVKLAFSEDVDVAIGDLYVRGVNNTQVTPTSFNYDPALKVATWQFSTISNDRLAITTSNYIQSKLTGKFLDASTADSDPSSSLMVRMSVLAGDVNQDGLVTASDYNNIRNTLFSFYGSPGYNIYNDANADGLITASDVNPIKNNLFTNRPRRLADDIRSQLPPGISKIQVNAIPEDAGLQSVILAVNSSTGNQGSEGTVSLSVSSSNQSLLPNSKLAIESQTGYYRLGFTTSPDQWGSSDLVVTASDSAGTNRAKSQLDVSPVNDAPIVTQPLSNITLLQPSGQRSINLTEVFGDIDDTSLTYRVISHTSEIFSASINGSQLSLATLSGKAGQGQLELEARDAGGLTVRLTTSVEVLAELDSIQYALVSDQIMDFNGKNTFILETNFDRSERIEIVSTDQTILRKQDVSIESLGGGKHRVILRHRTQDFGLTYLFFKVDQTVLSSLAVMVTPAPNATLPNFGELKFSHQQEVTEKGTLLITRSFNARFLASQLQNRAIDSATVFSLVRPVNPVDMMTTNAILGGTFSQNPEKVTSGSETVLTGRATIEVELPPATSVSINAKAYTPTKIQIARLFLENLFYNYRSEYDWRVNPMGEVNRGIAVSNPISLIAATLNLVGKSIVMTKFEADPNLSNQEANLNRWLSAVDAVSIAGSFAGSIRTLTKTHQRLGYIPYKAMKDWFIDQQLIPFDILKSLFGNKDIIKDVAEKKRMLNLVNTATEFSKASLQDLFEITSSVRQSIETDPQTTYSALDLSSLNFGSALLQESFDALTAARKHFETLDEEQDSILNPPNPGDLPVLLGIAATKEANGENGFDQYQLNGVIRSMAPEAWKTAKSIFQTGKKLFEIANKTKKIVSQVEDLFSNASEPNAYEYIDHDGSLQRMDLRQERSGTDNRDNINTGTKNDEVKAGDGDDRVSTLSGDDYLYGGEGRNTLLAGPGNDHLYDGSGDSHLTGDMGDDFLSPGDGNDVIDGGMGHDTIWIEGRNFGRDLLIDSSRSGVIRFTDISFEELTLRKDKYDLVIELHSSTSPLSSALRFSGYFENDAAGWEIVDKYADHYNLYAITGRISSYEALQVAFAPRNPSGTPALPAGIQPIDVLHDSKSRFTIHLAEDLRSQTDNASPSHRGLVVTIEGNNNLSGWFNRNILASLESANEIMQLLNAKVDLSSYDAVTVVGVGEGGLVAQWFSSVAATRGPSFVFSHLINTPDISGLMSQVVNSDAQKTIDGKTVTLATARPEYQAGFATLHNNFLVNIDDWISRLGVWSGNEELYATWKAYKFETDIPTTNLPELSDIQRTHSPTIGSLDFSSLDIVDMTLSQIRGVKSVNSASDMGRLFANISVNSGGETFDSTTNAQQVLVDETSTIDFDIREDSAHMRATYLKLLRRDATAVDPNTPFVMEFDFQAAAQKGAHLAEGSIEVNERTLFNPQISAPRQFGWLSVDGVKPGQDHGRASELERDSLKVSDAVFAIDLSGPGGGAGTYNLSITIGDREDLQESLQIYVDGYQTDRVSTMPGDFLTRTYQITTDSPLLRIRFTDLGGKHVATSINGLTLEKVNYRSAVPETERIETDPAVILVLPSYELPETNAAIEIYKQALYAAATAALTAGVGAALTMTSFGSSIAANLGGTVLTSFNQAAALGAKLSVQTALQSIVAPAALKAAGMSLITSIPENLISNPTARGALIQVATSIFTPKPAPTDFPVPSNKPKGIIGVLGRISEGLDSLSDGLEEVGSVIDAARGDLEGPTVATWVYDVVGSLTTMTQKFRLGRLDPSFVPVELEAVEQAIDSGKSPDKILKLWQGSRDFLVLDWVPDNKNLTQVSEQEQLQYTNRAARVLKHLLEAYSQQLLVQQPDAKFDLLQISHGAGYEISRELTKRLNNSDVAEALDYVQLVTLDPYASTAEKLGWYRPEFTLIVDRVVNLYQTEKDNSPLYHGGSNLGGLDGREGGSSLGMYNQAARIFNLLTKEEVLRFRNYDFNTASLADAELTDIRFSPDGSLVAVSDKNGNVSVRHVYDIPKPGSTTGELSARAGEELFAVWGHEQLVRAVSFVQIEQDGVWKDYLLSISAARDPENNSSNKNKIVLTDLETHMPVWHGTDIGGTQVAASPSGNVLVSTDSSGHAKVWKRVAGTITYEPLPDLVDAHTSANRNYVADVVVISDRYFVTAGFDGRAKLFVIDGNTVRLAQPALLFDDANEGEVRNLAYDPFNGILAIAAGETTSLWRFDQKAGRLLAWSSEGQNGNRFVMHDHVAAVQGLAFSKPGFLLDANGKYMGDRQITLSNGTKISIPRTEAGDIDQIALKELLVSRSLPSALKGLKLLTGGEDRTVLSYSLDNLNVNAISYDLVLTGNTLPIRELDVSSDGRTLAVVGIDNISDDRGGPIDDRDMTDRLDSRLEWKFSEIFLQGRREHNAITQEYVYSVIEEDGEAFFWLRNSDNANRPGKLASSRNLSVPFNKQNRLPGVDIAPLDFAIRPGETIEILPLQYLLEADREKFALDQSTLPLGEIRDTSGVLLGSLKLKRVDGQDRPNILVFTASDNLDFSAAQRTSFVAEVKVDINGPTDSEGKVRRVEDAPLKIRIINHKPIAYRDTVDLFPTGKIVDYRPAKNDYDPDNDSFVLVPFSSTWQTIPDTGEPLARVRANPNQPAGIDIEPLIDESRLAAILQAMGGDAEYVKLTIPYTIREPKFLATSTGTVEVRLRLPSGPENVRYTDLGADLVTLQWDIVTWAADRYVVERWDEQLGWRAHSTQSFVEGRTSDSLTIKVVPNTENWFRVVAVNTNTGRREASFEGNSRGGLYVRTPGYVGPGSVVMETLGPAAIEVRWEKVHWNVERYVVALRELLVGNDGQLIKDADGQYSFNPDTVRTESVLKGEGLSFKFTKLKAGTPYLAIVTARNNDIDVAESTFASGPIFTDQRLLPGAIELERVGPVAVRVSWATVGYAEKYRIVVMDPVTLVRVKTEIVEADKSRTRQSEVVLELPKPDKRQTNEWAIFVEAKKGDQWLSLMEKGTLLPLTQPAPNESQITVVAGKVPTYVLASEFNVPLRLPSVAGLIEGTEFLLMNFSRNTVRLVPFTSVEKIGFNGYYANEQLLSPAFGVQTSYGAIAYRLETVVDSVSGELRWSISTSETASQAMRVLTPPYLAAEAGSLEAVPTPYRMAVQFTSPYWNVTRHKIEILRPQVINGLTFWFEAAPPQTFWTEGQSSDNYQHTFKGLKPNTTYLIQLTTSGPAGTYFESITKTTEDLQSPIDPDFSDVTLRSFKATWSKVPWAQEYRVVLEQKISGQWTPIRTNDSRLRVGSANSQLVVADLDMGTEYRFTVEARSADPDAIGTNGGWITNDKTKVVKTLAFRLPASVFLVAIERKTTTLTLDWSAVFNTRNADDFLFGADHWKLWWKVDGSSDEPRATSELSGSQTQAVLANLKSNTNYELWVEFHANGVTQSVRLNTENNKPIATKPHQPVNRVEEIPADTGRHRFTVKWQHDDRNDVESFTVLASTDLNTNNWFAVGRFRDDGSFENGTNLSKDRQQFEVTRIRKANGDWDYLESDRLYYIKVRSIFPDIDPLDSNPPISVRTLDYPTPVDVAGTEATSRSIKLTWSHAEQIGNPDRFVIWKSNDGNTWEKLGINVKGDARFVIIQGLEPGTRNWFKVQAEYDFLNDVKRMSQSSPEIWTLDPTVQITQVQVDGKKAMTVFWSSFQGWEPNVMQIKIQKINDFGQPEGGWIVPEGGNITDDKSRTSKQITGLSIGTTYDVQLVIQNANGKEFKSQVVRQTTEAMAPITGLNTFDHRGSALYLQWKRLEIVEPNANVTRNQVDVFLNGSLVRTINTGSGQGQHHSVEVTGLSLGTSYQFKVTAFNDGEKLSQSELYSFATFTAATNVQVTPVAWQKMQVSWTPPSWSVEEYVIKLFEVGSTSVADTRTPPANSTWVNFGNLKVNQGYYATVVVKNAALKVTGVESNASPSATTYARTTPTLSPVVQVGSVLTFSWTHFAPPEIGSNLRYRIERRPLGGSWNTVKAGIVPVEGQSNQSFSIRRQDSNAPLNAKTLYEFRVVAVYLVEELNSNVQQHQVLP